MTSEHDGEEDGLGLFQEPADFYLPEKQATFASHQLSSGEELTVRLVGHNPLWGHFLWNAGRTISTYLEERREKLIAGKTVLELGAGAGLPSLVCALNGATQTVVTDYPDAELIENLRYNIDHCAALPKPPKIVAEVRAHMLHCAIPLTCMEGYLWGAPTKDLTRHLPNEETFDVLILADLLFNHSEHGKLIKTVRLALKKSPASRAYVVFTPYRPWLIEKDLAFFDLARNSGFVVSKIFEKVMEKVMFDEDPGVSSKDGSQPAISLTTGRMNCFGAQYLVTSFFGQSEIFIRDHSYEEPAMIRVLHLVIDPCFAARYLAMNFARQTKIMPKRNNSNEPPSVTRKLHPDIGHLPLSI